MKKIVLSLAFMLIGTFAFVNTTEAQTSSKGKIMKIQSMKEPSDTVIVIKGGTIFVVKKGTTFVVK